MTTEITVLTKQDLEANPSIVGENLAQLALAIEDTKSDLSDIRERGFWKRLTNNNTRDLAGAMLKQNDTISAFLTIVQGIMFLSMNNIIVLGGIMDALNKAEKTNDIRDNKYIGMAKDYLSEAIKSARKATNNEMEIENVKMELITYYKKQENQERLLSDLTKEINKQNELTQQLKGMISNNNEMISKQDLIGKKQVSLIEQLEEEVRGLKKKLIVSYIVAGAGIASTIIAIALELYI